MHCQSCKKSFKKRSELLVHSSVCGSGALHYNRYSILDQSLSDSDVDSPADDTDDDPNWNPSLTQSSPPSSPLTEEQVQVASEVQSLLLGDEEYIPSTSCLKNSGTGTTNELQRPFPDKKGVEISEETQGKNNLTDKLANVQKQIEEWRKKKKEANKQNCKNIVRRLTKKIKTSESELEKIIRADIRHGDFTHEEQPTESGLNSGSDVQHSQDIVQEVDVIIPELPEPGEEHDSKWKKYFCIFCNHLVSHFARYLCNKHKEEEEVIQLTSLSPGDKRRKEMINKIRGRGTIVFNSSHELNKGNLILVRRATIEVDQLKLKPCPNCLNYYRKASLWRHHKLCTKKKNAPRDLQKQSEAIVINTNPRKELSEVLSKEVLPGMVVDDVKRYLLTDEVILDYGEFLCTKYKLDKHLINMIRTKLRQVAKITREIIIINPSIKNLDEALDPSHYDTFIEAANRVAGFDGNSYKSPSLINELGRAMKVIANRRIINCIKNKDLKKKTDIENWLHIYSNDFYHSIGKSALMAIQKKKWGRTQLLPLTEDVMKLNEHIKMKKSDAENVLKDKFDEVSFSALNKCLIAEIQIFNRRRPLKVEMLRVQDFDKRHNIQKDTPSYDSLTPAEKLISSRYMRVEARGKLHLKPAAMLLSLQQVSEIKLLLQYRTEAGITKSNPYVFGMKDKFFKAYVALKELAYASEAKRPDLLIGTLLRKHIATTVQALSLTENDLTNLATFMSHDILTHRKFYRIPNEAVHLAKLSRLLVAMNTGSISNFYGKPLEDINVNIEGSEEDEATNEELEIDTVQELESPNENSMIIAEDPYSDVEEQNKITHKKHLTPQKKPGGSRMSWTTPERHVARKIFKKYFSSNNNILPTPLECREAIRENKELYGRTINQLKGWVFSERKRLIKKKC